MGIHVTVSRQEAGEVQEEVPEFELLPVLDFLKIPLPGWIIRDVLQDAGQTMIFAQEGTGKSYLGLELAYCSASGESWLGFPVEEQRPVVYVAAERWQEQAKRANAYNWNDLPVWFVRQAVDLSTPRETKALLELAPAEAVMIFDTFEACGSLGDQKGVLTSYALIRESGRSTVLIHHPRKLGPGVSTKDPEREHPVAWGPSAILNPQDVRLLYKSVPGKPSIRTLEFQKNNLSADPISPIEVTLKDGRPVLFNTKKKFQPTMVGGVS